MVTAAIEELIEGAVRDRDERGRELSDRPRFEQGTVCVAHLDSHLVVRQANQEFFQQFGGGARDLCGCSFCDLLHPSVRQSLIWQFAGLLEGRRHRFVAQVVADRPSDGPFTGTLTAVAVRGESPGVTAVLALLRPGNGDAEADVVTGRKKILSELDARILEGIAAGMSTIALASRLYLSRQGVEYRVTGLLRKLRVPNRAALVSRAFAMGVLNVGSWPPKVVEEFIK